MKITEMQLRALIKEAITVIKESRFDYTKHKTGEIAKAVVRALEILDIKNQNLLDLMIGIARTESGGNPAGVVKDDLGNLVITGHTNNPFQLDDIALDNVRTNPNLAKWRIFENEKQGSNPSNLSDPLSKQSNAEIRNNVVLSALFATLHILWATKNWKPDNRKNFKFPGTSDGQAEVWKAHYNTTAGKGAPEDYILKNS